MKKKLESLLLKGRVKSNAEFKKLYSAYQTTKAALEQAKNERSETRQAYREEALRDERNSDRILELLMAYRQAKSMVKYHRAGWQWAKHCLQRWIKIFLAENPQPEKPAKVRSAKTKSEKSAPPASPAPRKPAKKRNLPEVEN